MAEIPVDSLLQCLVECSQKAAKIAQIFRDEEDLFGLLVERKSDIKKNKQLIQDYKTLADVLVQETIKKDVGEKFPAVKSKIQGEEQNQFQNALGESILVELTDSPDDTVNLLYKVLDGRENVAKRLASVVHSSKAMDTKEYSSSSTIPADTIGIWIDPIDSTAEYIQAKSDETEDHNIQTYGLRCVCVLIGVYCIQTGNPIIGVINQPFYKKEEASSEWENKFFWGINYNTETASSITWNEEDKERTKIIVISSSESDELQDVMRTKYTVIHAAGAGYKALLVATMKADLYILSQPNTYFWDTCGPHALLSAKNGGIVNFQDKTAIKNKDELTNFQIKYFPNKDVTGTHRFQNFKGIIAYRDSNDVIEFFNLLRENGYYFKTLKKNEIKYLL
ncbi:inositol polyphosphate 1-phosphatase-like isoform X2 [Stegodyphus dumicola]|nr:inositol polyphosphate 1-phosphatase-like isoform X2 [Stegodyphus dumicola]XP_035223306.1 inositol polyphosphate 1-phosphatase-like isoform X2 [Stegodyphus dumicola]